MLDPKTPIFWSKNVAVKTDATSRPPLQTKFFGEEGVAKVGVPLTPLPLGRPIPQSSIGRPWVDLRHLIEYVFLGKHCSRNPHSMRQVFIGPPKK